ncbi:MAG: FecR domain-containing protein [Scytolyngbya sp. HA4215-MV1]|jgi:hypothetical protein|nr:FecR domain-containing protein [Scytolyngbya sp. HA4215-MV1]
MVSGFSRFRVRGGFQHWLALGLVGFCIVLMLDWLWNPTIVHSASIQQATLSEILDGNQVYIQNKQARLNDRANQGQRIRTGKTRVQLNFNTGAVARLSYNSVLTVGQCARLQRGTLLVNGAVSGCTPSVVAGVRGTTYLLTVNEAGDTQVQVLEGKVVVNRSQTSVSDIDDLPEVVPAEKGLPRFLKQRGLWLQSNPHPNPQRQAQIPLPAPPLPSSDPPPLPKPAQPDQSTEVVLGAGEKVMVDPKGVFGKPEKLSQEDFVNLLSGALFKSFTEQLPGIDKVRQSFEQLYPGVPFPIHLPGVPSLPIPVSLPRLPF